MGNTCAASRHVLPLRKDISTSSRAVPCTLTPPVRRLAIQAFTPVLMALTSAELSVAESATTLSGTPVTYLRGFPPRLSSVLLKLIR